VRVTKSAVSNGVAVAIVAAVLGLVVRANGRGGSHAARGPEPRLAGTARAPSTTRDGLHKTIGEMRARIARNPTDARAAVVLADALLRQARVSGNVGLALEAEHALSAVLKNEPLEYEARRMLATVYLSEHRFGEAVREAEQARDQFPRDPWNYGVIGDGHLELGDYDEAFAAFQEMLDLRPSASAYARASYSYELRGNLAAALDAMRMAADATSPRDPESLAWHHAQIGNLLLQLGRAKEARAEYEWAATFWPGHPAAIMGLGRLKEFEGDHAGALELYVEQFKHAPTPDLAAQIGDVYAVLGNRADSERHYALAEAGWRSDAPEPKNLARFLADRGRSPDQAVTIAEQAARDRHDIFTEDALAWAYFRAGRLAEASRASTLALRTGTRDRALLYHAAAIKHATGDADGARTLVARSLEGNPRFDLVSAPAARALRETLAARGVERPRDRMLSTASTIRRTD
jgi:tetratricopeptide (TPR) repeat protein